MEKIYLYVPKDLVEFILISLVSFVIGLSQRKLHENQNEQKLFGTDRTFTFIGILGYLLYMADPQNKWVFMMGFVILSVFFSVFYWYKIRAYSDSGITSILIALITYSQVLVLHIMPTYMYLLMIVIVLMVTEMKQSLLIFTAKIDSGEFITLAKFMVMAGVVLPVLPDTPIVSFLTISPYKIWLAVVVISSISYISYLLRKFVFRDSGLLLTGILGGLYSSTATTIVLSRKTKENPEISNQITAAILLALSMMYLRITFLVYLFNKEIAKVLAPYLIMMILVSIIAAAVLYFLNRKEKKTVVEMDSHQNPLEFNVAMIFTLIYVVFSFINHYAIQTFGESGLNVLAVIVGVADIDPFLLNMFQGKFDISLQMIAGASLLAIVSNNFLKMFYAMALFHKKYWKYLISGFMVIIIFNILFNILVLNL